MDESVKLSNLDMSESKISTEYCGHSLMAPHREITLIIANARRGTWPWYHEINFSSREQWFKFVRLINRCNELVKKTPKDEEGFPIFDEAKLDYWRKMEGRRAL